MAIDEFKKLSVKKKIEKTIFIIQKIQFIIKKIYKDIILINNNLNYSLTNSQNNKKNNSKNINQINNRYHIINNNILNLENEFIKLTNYVNFINLNHPKFKDSVDYFLKTKTFKTFEKLINSNINNSKIESSNKVVNLNINNKVLLKQEFLNKIVNQKDLYIEQFQKFIYKLKDIANIENFKNDFDRINKNLFNKVELLNSSTINKVKENYTFEVLCADIRSPFNIGSIIRSAESFGFNKIWLYGISSNVSFKKVFKTSKLAENFIEIKSITYKEFLKLKEEKYWDCIVGLETFENSISINNIKINYFKNKNLIIVGNEEFGISDDLISLIDIFINIPMVGNKNSINVANAFSVIAYKLLELKLNNSEMQKYKNR